MYSLFKYQSSINKMLDKSLKSEKTCRACTKTESELVSLYDRQQDASGSDGLRYSDMIKEFTMYLILEGDALPQHICLECVDKVRISYEFKKQFEESQKKLLSMVVETIKDITIEPLETIFYNCNDQLSSEINDDHESKSPRRRSGRNFIQKDNDSSAQNVPKDEVSTSNDKRKRNQCSKCSKEFVHLGHLKNHLNKCHKDVKTPVIETIEKLVVKSETTELIVSTNADSDAEDDHFDLRSDNDEDAINCPETGSIKSFKAETDSSETKTNIEEISKTEGNNEEIEGEHLKPEKIKKPRENKPPHPERRFQCETCNKSFKRNSHLKQHLLCHTKLKPYECTICQRKFSRTDNLKVHMSNHGKRQFECDCCERSFGQAYLLKRHKEQTHSEEKPFLCSECGQRFVRNGDLAVHMRRHKGEKPYKCQYCNKGFTRSTEVYVHERYHTGEKKHVCNICGKAFQRPYNLVVHVRTHTGERPYQCPHCPKNFAQCSDLKAHIRRHTGERYKCDKCSMGFIHVFVLNQHKRNVHGIDVPARIIRIAKLNKEINKPPPPIRYRTAQGTKFECPT
ncbi:zinc finger protein ZFP2-like [Eupeodes corollae]|uniref:zinc finger protein ZFP2-like n=1 Tax=Eupeodes corollae TaxID=290404 RepID=UPI002491450B|nr:zinc finger protein ZFP2-like [Eupeodes corollae]